MHLQRTRIGEDAKVESLVQQASQPMVDEALFAQAASWAEAAHDMLLASQLQISSASASLLIQFCKVDSMQRDLAAKSMGKRSPTKAVVDEIVALKTRCTVRFSWRALHSAHDSIIL